MMTDSANQYWQNPPRPQIGSGVGAAGILTAGIVYAFLAYMAWRLSDAPS